MKKTQPILVLHLFPEILEHLLALLSGLSDGTWKAPTACAGWSVKSVALHLLAGDVGILSRQRDRFAPADQHIGTHDELVALVNGMNASWVQATQRLSPRLLCDLLQFTGYQVCDYFRSLDPYALGGPVTWVGRRPAPVWLDLAREYTERWHHQQHIRDAVGQPGLREPRFLAPALDTFARALPYTFRHAEAAHGTLITLTITGDAGNRWSLLRQQGEWHLFLGAAQRPDCEVVMDEDIAWRLFTKGLGKRQALAKATILGDQSLGLLVLDMVSILA